MLRSTLLPVLVCCVVVTAARADGSSASAATPPSLVAPARQRAQVIVFDGWGAPGWLRIGGRVLEDKAAPAPRADANALENAATFVGAFETDEVVGADVRVEVAGRSLTATTDGDGMFSVQLKGLRGDEKLAIGTLPVVVTVTSPARFAGSRGEAVVHVLPQTDAIALVSDIDDTVVKTYVVDKARAVGNALSKNAAQLEPVDGAAVNYRNAVARGVAGVFYLSGSPIHLHARLRAFLDVQQFPRGPMILKNLETEGLLAVDTYKLAHLEKLVSSYPRMRFVCVGDSGEKDPEIYRELRRRHPAQVAAIVIRLVPGGRNDAGRFVGMTTVDDRYTSDDIIAQLLPAPVLPAAELPAEPAPTAVPERVDAGAAPPATSAP